MADQRLSIFSKKGVLLDRVQASFSFTEGLNDFGTGEFTMSISDPKCTQRNLTFGNYVLFEHARLGAWAGVMAPNNGQDWNDNDTITTRCLSAEYQFWRRRAPLYDLTLDKPSKPAVIVGTEGFIVNQLLRYANVRYDMLLRPGKIYTGGGVGVMALRYAMLGELVQQVLERTPLDFWVSPAIVDGLLQFKVNLQLQRGRDLAYILRERINVEKSSGPHHRLDGEIINDVLVTAEGADAAIKPFSQQSNEQSIAEYGPWQGFDSIPGDEQLWAEMRASQIIKASGRPRNKDKIVAIESPESPKTFSFIGLGDTVTIQKDSAVFYGSRRSYSRRARIAAREYNSEIKKCILTMAGDDE